jgi:hypothetical protein
MQLFAHRPEAAQPEMAWRLSWTVRPRPPDPTYDQTSSARSGPTP